MTRRSDRIGDEIRRILAEVIQRKLNDPRLHGIVSLTDVVVSSDLSTARVFYSVYGDEEKSEDVRQAFGKATPFLRRTLSERLRTRRIPRLIFNEDHSMKEGERMDALIRRVHEESLRARQDQESPEDVSHDPEETACSYSNTKSDNLRQNIVGKAARVRSEESEVL